MAITIEQQPASPQYSYNDIIYVVSSDLVGPTIAVDDLKAQYSTVVDVYDLATTSVVFTTRKQPNPQGVTVFNISQILNDLLDYDINALGSTVDAIGVTGSKSYEIRFGEEYIENKTLTVFNGGDVVGNPAAAANTLFVVKGFQEYDSKGLFAASPIPSVLTERPSTTIRIHRDDKMTISEYNSSIPQIIHHNIVVPTDTSVTTFSDTIGTSTFTFNIYDNKSEYGETRFAWYNRIGGVEYFNATEMSSLMTAVSKSRANHPVVDWGASTVSNAESANSNVYRSSSSVYATSYNEMRMVETKWLTEAEADWVSGLFDSPLVYIQNGDEWIPVEIMNSAYDANSYTRDARLFNYTIEYRHINNKRGF